MVYSASVVHVLWSLVNVEQSQTVLFRESRLRHTVLRHELER